jgi:NADPH2:quinone reductase
MKVIDISQPGPPEVLTLVDRPLPQVGPNEVLIKVAAAGVNRPDLLQRRGKYPPPPGAPSHPGLEVAGHIVEVGANVSDFHVDEAVCALLQGGGYAEYVAVDARLVLRVPRGLSMIEAASLPETCFTVWANVFERARLAGTDSLLVHGGASGIGVMAIQLAKAFGHTVYATAGTEEKCRFCEQLGAARAIDYRREDFVEAIRTLTNGRGVDVVLDMVGGSYLERNLSVLASEGRLVLIATQGGRTAQLDIATVMQKGATITGSLLRPRTAEFKGRIRDELARRVWPLFEAGQVRAAVDKVFPLADAAAAHAYLESGAHKGKVVLEVA